MSTSREENQKELEFIQKLSKSITETRQMIGKLTDLPTSDKTSIVNSIRSLTLGQYTAPEIDSDKIIQKFNENLI